MIRLYKPARSKERGRGLFSYLTESVINMTNFIKINGDTEIKYYHDLYDIPGYGRNNIFDVCMTQDEFDYQTQKNLYTDIELTENFFNLDCYNPATYNNEVRSLSEYVVNKFFVPNDELKSLFLNRHSEIDFNTTIGVHRRATDIKQHHKIVDLETIYQTIESEEFEHVFLMCDNLKDNTSFKRRYGNKIITYDDFTSNKSNLPFFKQKNDIDTIEKHIMELLFGVFTLSETKLFVCSKSNLSSFTILINQNLNYKLLL